MLSQTGEFELDRRKTPVLELMKPLLADRFQVAIHWETKQLPRYLLVVGKGGSKLKEAEADGEPELGISCEDDHRS